MKLSYAWLKEWVPVPWDVAELGSRLTLAGFELESLARRADDFILELNITPNRGDVMSVLGLAREVAAIARCALTGPLEPVAAMGHRDTFPVEVDEPAACPTFCGRIVRGVDNTAPTPTWLKTRLQGADVRSVSPIVDITNYVLLELGQPMHAYDLAKLDGTIGVRYARPGEPLELLDARSVALEPDMLVIADRNGAIGLAGIMGGAHAAVAPATRDVFFEVAYFAPAAVQGRGRRLGLLTDASQRYERGVDPGLQQRAMERATGLLLGIAGGSAGPVTCQRAPEQQRRPTAVTLRRVYLARLLGASFDDETVAAILRALQMKVEPTATGWSVTPPTYRFDIGIEADLVEEVARLVGFEAIPETVGAAVRRFPNVPREWPAEVAVLEAMSARGYHEAITYAFVDPALQERLFPERAGLLLANPIASDLAAMRVSLWPGLLSAAAENQRRQQGQIRLMERGICFLAEGGGVREVDTFAAVACGERFPEQWGVPRAQRAPVDFFDLKADLEMLLAATGAQDKFSFEATAVSCLHPGRAARVLREGQPVGWLGELHPDLVRQFDFTYPPILLEVVFYDALRVEAAAYVEFSRFPAVRRDLAIVVNENVPLSALRESVTLVSSSLLRQCRVFDVYRGPELEVGTKSIALGLIFQDFSSTLTDEDVDCAVASIIAGLRASLNAKIRDGHGSH